MTAFWLGVCVGVVAGVAVCAAALVAMIVIAAMSGRAEPEWPPTGDW